MVCWLPGADGLLPRGLQTGRQTSMESCSSPGRVCTPQGRDVLGGRLPMKRSSKALCYLSSSSSTGGFFPPTKQSQTELISAGELVSLHTPQLQVGGWGVLQEHLQIVFPSSKQLVFNQ